MKRSNTYNFCYYEGEYYMVNPDLPNNVTYFKNKQEMLDKIKELENNNNVKINKLYEYTAK